jgi:hypothetical protein
MYGTIEVTTNQSDWWIVFDTLREAKKRLEKEGVRHSWMDGAIAIAKDHANV